MFFSLTGSNNTAETGATIYVDDVYLGKPKLHHRVPRRNVTTLRTMNLGSLRYMNPSNSGSNDGG